MRPQLRRLFEDYADAHRHPMNQLTHKIAIPMIVFHAVAMSDWIALFQISPTWTVTAAHTGIVAASLWYLWMHPKLGLIMTAGLVACAVLGAVTPASVVILVAIVGWIVQLAGHAVFERNSPAFLRNLVQTLVGPLFFLACITGDWPGRMPPQAFVEQ